ncbi:phenylacetic acid degradation protein PaaD [Nakamurella sp. UYEF19]|uniref:hotdog domain-containing protein n=1 Tax=Nakamurella sp. UYEF19 TaxID=1756392 RepID=UPI003390FFA0
MADGYGGIVFSLADTAFACACNSDSRIAVAADCSIVFVRPVLVGDTLVARARERTRFGRSGRYDVTIICGDSLVAEFRGRSHELKEPPR